MSWHRASLADFNLRNSLILHYDLSRGHRISRPVLRFVATVEQDVTTSIAP